MNTQECCLQGCYSVSSDSFNFVYAVSMKMEPGKKLGTGISSRPEIKQVETIKG